MFRSITSIWILPIVFGLIIIMGCGESLDNFPPEISVFETESQVIEPGQQAFIKLTVVDVDSDELKYSWSSTGGKIAATVSGGTWTAPEEEGRYEIQGEVSDGTDRVQDTLEIFVWRPRPGDYYPLAIGNKWVFRDGDDNQITFEIVEKIEIENTDEEAYVSQISNSDPELEGIFSYAYLNKRDDGTGVDQYANSVAPGSPDTIIYIPWLPIYNFPLIPGDSWELEFRAKLPEGYFIGEGVAKYEVLAEETVTVPAGTFEHVIQVRETFEWKLINESLDRTVSTKWLAPDVGLVKVDQEQTRGEQTMPSVLLLESFEIK